jgi:hypothetical protein
MLNNQPKISRILQSSKNSSTVLKKSYPTKNQKLMLKRKFSKEKYKTQIINHIYNKLFLYSNDYIQNVSDSNKNMNNSNYNNFMNKAKRSINKNFIRNSQKYKSINQKNSIPVPMKKTSKDKLKIKTKLYGSYMSNDLSKNYLKPTNSTTEINITFDDNNLPDENLHNEKKKESNKLKNNNDEKTLELKNNTKKTNINISNHNQSIYNNILNENTNTNHIIKNSNPNSNNKVIKIIETKFKSTSKQINDKSKNNKNKIIQKKNECN